MKITEKELQKIIREEVTALKQPAKVDQPEPELPQLMTDEEIEAEFDLNCRPWNDRKGDPRCKALWDEYNTRETLLQEESIPFEHLEDLHRRANVPDDAAVREGVEACRASDGNGWWIDCVEAYVRIAGRSWDKPSLEESKADASRRYKKWNDRRKAIRALKKLGPGPHPNIHGRPRNR